MDIYRREYNIIEEVTPEKNYRLKVRICGPYEWIENVSQYLTRLHFDFKVTEGALGTYCLEFNMIRRFGINISDFI